MGTGGGGIALHRGPQTPNFVAHGRRHYLRASLPKGPAFPRSFRATIASFATGRCLILVAIALELCIQLAFLKRKADHESAYICQRRHAVPRHLKGEHVTPRKRTLLPRHLSKFPTLDHRASHSDNQQELPHQITRPCRTQPSRPQRQERTVSAPCEARPTSHPHSLRLPLPTDLASSQGTL